MRILKSLILFSGIFILSSQNHLKAQEIIHAYQQDPDGRPREHNIDVERMFADLSFEPAKGIVKGTVTHYFKTIQQKVDSIVFDGPDMTFKNITLDNAVCRFQGTPAGGLVIYMPSTLAWGSSHALAITYEASPKKGLYFIGFNDSTGRRRKQMWTQGEEVDNRYWIPGYDDPSDKLVTEMQVTMDAGYKVLSNGNQLGQKKNKDGSITWHYKISHPHCFYLTMLGIGDYAIYKTQNSRGVPIYEYYYPDKPEELEPTYRYTGRIMDILEKEIDYNFGWESYAQIPIGDFMYGAMENTTATTFGDFFMVDKRGFIVRNYIGVNAHEMTHQWFGDLVSAKSPRDQWLQESFATYYPQFVTKDLYGQDAYDWGRWGAAQAALNASKENLNPIVGTKGGGARIYQKGAFVLGMLSNVVGHDEFQKAVKAYLTKFAYQNVNTNDFYMSFYDVLGRNLDWFFDEWLYRGGEPDYHVHYDKFTKNGKPCTQVYIDQVQKISELNGYFKMPITVEVHYKDGSLDSKTELVENEHHIMLVPNSAGKEVDYVLFDPNYTILKHTSFDKGFDEWQAQALHAPNMLDKYEALVALRVQPMKDKKDMLNQLYHKVVFHALKEEILSQLATDKSAEARNIFKEAMADKDAEVRFKAVESTAKIPAESRTEYEALLTDSSYNVINELLPKLCETFPENTAQYLQKTDKVDGLNKEVRTTWLRIACRKPDDAHLKELVDYASNSFEFRTRVNAFKALENLNYADLRAINGLLEASQSWNGRLANPAKETLAYFYKQAEKKTMIDSAIAKGKWTDAQKEKLSKLFKG
jgi:aminopeptidase N